MRFATALLTPLTALAAVLPAALAPAFAQPPGGPQAAAPAPETRYRVEIILFAYNNADTGGEDLFHGIDDPRQPPVPGLLRPSRIELETLSGFDPRRDGRDAAREADALSPATNANSATGAIGSDAGADAAAAGTAADGQLAGITDNLAFIEPATSGPGGPNPLVADRGPALPPAFRPLRSDEFTLSDIASMLRRVPRYRLIAHAGWEQAGVAEVRAVPVDLANLGIANVDGEITLWLGRFLHIGVDLRFYDRNGTRWMASPGPGLAPLEYATSYRVHGERNAIRSGELHVIDHPLYGIAVMITPAPEAEELPADSGAGPAA